MRRLTLALALTMVFLAGLSLRSGTATWIRPRTIAAQNDCQAFPETGKSVCGIFLSYWKANGGLAQQGFSISDVFKEQSSNGQTYDTQYFERAVFERHPEHAGTKFEVLLALVGSERLKLRYPNGPPAASVPAPVAPTATSVPVAPPPLLPSGLVVLSSSSYVVSSGLRYIVGEVLNNTNQNQEFVKIVAGLYDAGGTLVRTETGYSELEILEPKQRGAFDVLISDSPANAQRYELQVQGRATADQPLKGLQILSSTSRAINNRGRQDIIGEVRNNSGGPARFVKIIATMYDAASTVVAVEVGYTDIDVLASGQASPFDILVEHWVNVARYDLAIQGRRP